MNRTNAVAKKFEAQRREERLIALKHSGYSNPTEKDTMGVRPFPVISSQ